jgi:hypothetical protein
MKPSTGVATVFVAGLAALGFAGATNTGPGDVTGGEIRGATE